MFDYLTMLMLAGKGKCRGVCRFLECIIAFVCRYHKIR